MKKTLSLALSTMALLAAASCSCGNNVGQAKVGSVNGVVIKGPVAAATVTAFALDGARKGDEVGKGTTAEDGTFTFEVGSHSGPMLVCATSGTYVEESTGGLVQLGTNELCGIATAHEAGATSTVLVTPLTSLHAALTGCFLDAGRDANVGAAEQHAALRLNDFFAAGQVGFDLRTTVPVDVTAGLAASLTNEAWSGILVAGISESAKGYAVASGLDPGVRVTAATLTTALIQDIDDGACLFDGQTSTSRLVQGTIDLDENTLRGSPQGLATSILRFLESERNLSGIAQENVRDLVQTMQAHTSEIFGGGGGGADIDSPIVSYSEPTAGSTRGGSVRVTARAVDASRIVEFAFTAPDQAAFIASTFTCTDDTATDCTVTGTLNTGLAPVVDGPLDIVARAVDAAGNPTSATLSFAVNNTLPSIQVATPQNEQAVDAVFVINATASDAEGIASLTVEIPGIGLCDDQPTSPCRDIQPANDTLQVAWDTTTQPEGNVTLLFRAVDAAGQEAQTEVTVLIDNNDIGAITGFVDLGTPVFGATVTALVWTGCVRGGVLGTATTSETGAYRVDLDDAEHASVLMVVTGGRYVDLATGVEFAVADGQELTTAVGAIAPGEVRTTNVNAWTTLAAARAKHTPAGGLEVDAINLNTALLSGHMRRVGFGSPFSAATTKSADLTNEVVQVDDQRAVLALSHAGLSRLASELSVTQVANIGAVSTTGLIHVLAQDLQGDPALDGVGPTDVLTIGPDLEPITSLTTRFDLVAALDRYLKAVPLIGANVNRNVSGITADDAFQGRLYEAMAEDNRSELYPEPGRPFDTTPPVITLDFGGTNNDAQPGDPLRDTVQINGDADDDSAIATFGGTLTIDGAFIPDDDNNSTNEALRVFIATNVLPNASDAAGACPNATDAADVSVLQDSVCLCAIAEDVQTNVAEKILCFTRPLPTVAFEPPSPLNGASVTGNATVAARVTTGFDLASFNITGAAVALPVTRPTAETLQVTVPTSFVDTANRPNIVVTMQATDIAGRTTPASLTFTRPAPSTSITSPNEGANEGVIIRGGQEVQLTAAATSGFNLATCTATLASSPARTPPTLPLPTLTGTSCSFTSTNPVASFDDARWTLTVTATDIAGRSVPATRSFVTDKTPPSVTQPVLSGTDVTFADALFVRARTGRTSVYDASTTATDSAGIGSVIFRVTPAVGTAFDVPATRSGTTNTFTAIITDNGSDGQRTVVAIATDANQNSATSTGRAITKDTIKPAFVWTATGNQATWLNQTPGAAVTECTRESSTSAIRLACSHVPSTQINSVTAFYNLAATPPTNTIDIWRNNLGALFTPDGGVLPNTRGSPSDPGSTASGVASVLYDANTTCPSNPTNLAVLDGTQTTATITLGKSPMTIDLASRTIRTNLCMTAVAVDNAGNRSDPAAIRFNWRTVPPPLNVLWNPVFDETNAGLSDDFNAFAGPNADTFVEGRASNIRVAHAYVSNPFNIDVLFRLLPSGIGAALPLAGDVTRRELVSGTPATRWLVGTPTTSFQAPSGSGIINDAVFPNYNPSTPTTATRAWEFTSVSSDFRTVDALNTSTARTASSAIIRNLDTGTLPRPRVRYFSVNQTTGVITNATALTEDADGFVTVPRSASGGLFGTTPTVILAVYFVTGASNTLNLTPPGAQDVSSPLLRNAINGQAPLPSTSKFIVDGTTTQFQYQDSLPHVFLNVNPGTRGGPEHLCGSAAGFATCFWAKRFAELRSLKVLVPLRVNSSPTVGDRPNVFGEQSTKIGSTVADYASSIPVKAPKSLLDSASINYSLRESLAP